VSDPLEVVCSPGRQGNTPTLAIEDVIDSCAQAHLLPKITRAPVSCPVATPLNFPGSRSEFASRISLDIGKHSFRLRLPADDCVHVTCANVDRVSYPSAVCADCQNHLPGKEPALSVKHPRGLFRDCQYASNLGSGPRQVRAVRGKRQEIGQDRHTLLWRLRRWFSAFKLETEPEA